MSIQVSYTTLCVPYCCCAFCVFADSEFYGDDDDICSFERVSCTYRELIALFFLFRGWGWSPPSRCWFSIAYMQQKCENWDKSVHQTYIFCV